VSIGKLFRSSDNQFVAEVSYQFQDKSPTSWWGELTLTDFVRIKDNEGYIIELEDARRGNCRLRKRVNRAVTGFPTRYVYQFSGTGTLK